MLDNDILVEHTYIDSTERTAIPKHLNRILGSNASDIKDAVILYAAYCVYISYEELYSIYRPLSSQIRTNAIPSLIKLGFLKKVPLTIPEGTAKVVFSITASGYKYASSLVGGMLPVKYRTGRNPISIGHIYATGYNFFKMLSLNIPLKWQREELYTAGYGKSGDLQIDAICTLYPAHNSHRMKLYFEQDMGYELPVILEKKLESYEKFGLMDSPSEIIVFSMRQKGISKPSLSNSTPYSPVKLRALLQEMDKSGIEDAYEMLLNGFEPSYLRSLLTLFEVLDENGKKKRNALPLTKSVLKDYLEELSFCKNSFEHREYNAVHMNLAWIRLRYILQGLISNGSILPIYGNRLLTGYSILFIPTTLVAGRIKSFLPFLFEEEKAKLHRMLLPLFGPVLDEGELSGTLELSGNKHLRLRNCFSFSYAADKRGYVCIEHLSFDLGGWLRAIYFRKYYKGDIPYHLICVFDTPEQYRLFFKLCDYLYPHLNLILNESSILGLMRKDIGKENKLFSVTNPVDYDGKLYMTSSLLSS